MIAPVFFVITLMSDVTGAVKVLSTDSSQLFPNWTGQAEILNCSLEHYPHFRQEVIQSPVLNNEYRNLNNNFLMILP